MTYLDDVGPRRDNTAIQLALYCQTKYDLVI
jgi:hypothetical protein